MKRKCLPDRFWDCQRPGEGCQETTDPNKNHRFAGLPRSRTGPGQPVSGRTDIYSLGVVIWEALVGEHPYEALLLSNAFTNLSTTPCSVLHIFEEISDGSTSATESYREKP